MGEYAGLQRKQLGRSADSLQTPVVSSTSSFSLQSAITTQAAPASLNLQQLPDTQPTPEQTTASTQSAFPGHDFSRISIFPKLSVSPPDDPPNDPSEREAEPVAEQVMRMPESKSNSPSPAPLFLGHDFSKISIQPRLQPNHFEVFSQQTVQRQCAACAEEEEELSKTGSTAIQRDEAESSPVSDDQNAANNGTDADSSSTPDPQLQAVALQQLEQQLIPETIQSALEQIDLSGLSISDNASTENTTSTPNLFASRSPLPTTSFTSEQPNRSNSIFRQATPPSASAPSTSAEPSPPRNATAGDLLRAIMAVPAINSGLISLRTQAMSRISQDWSRLNTGEQVGLVSTTVLIGAGTLTGVFLNPEARRFALDKLNGQVLPVPGVNWLHLELNTGGDNLMLGMHLDIGRLLPSGLGFGPSSPSAIGSPPQPEPLPGQRTIQRQEAHHQTSAAGDIAQRIQAASGSGSKLDEGVQQHLENHLGANLSNVRVHTNSEADQLSKSVNAIAFTTGQDIFFSSGRYNPASEEGQHLIAHEVVHTVQQSSGAVAGTPTAGGVSISDPSDQFEQEAERIADQVKGEPGTFKQDSASSSQPSIQRTPAHPLANSMPSIQREDAESSSMTPSQLIDQHTSWIGNLDETELGRDLARRLPSQSSLAHGVLNQLPDSDKDDIAYETAAACGEKLSSLPEDLRIRLIREMVYGVVIDEEEQQISNLWTSFGSTLSQVAENNRELWKKSLWESGKLGDHLKPKKDAFREDVIGLAKAYLAENKQVLFTEAKRYGIDLEGQQSTVASHPDYLESVRAIVPGVLKLKHQLDELRQIQVGYNPVSDCLAGDCRHDANFNPELKPAIPPDGTESPPWPTWEEVKTQYDRISAVISAFANIYPTVYMLIQQDQLEVLTQSGDATQAQNIITQTLEKMNGKIKEADTKIGGDITHYDLPMIQNQLFTESAKIPYAPQYPWQESFYQDIAKDDIKGHETRQFWTDMGLSLAAAAALIAAPFTGGATAAFLVGFGVGIGTAQAGMSWDKYLDKSAVGDAHVKDELILISQGEVTAQLVDAVIQTATVFLDVYGAKAATAGARASRETLEAAERGLKEQLAEELRNKMLREAAKEGGMTAAGAGLAIGLHELAEEDEPVPEFEGVAQHYQLDLGSETSTDSPVSISPMLIQRSGGSGGGAGATVASKSPIILTGGEFELQVEKALLQGKIGGLPQISFVIPGQYTGSGWGVDRIGIVFDENAGLINVYHLEMKYVQEGSPHVPKLGTPSTGTQTGAGWTQNAVDGFLNSQHPKARAGRERLRRAMQKMHPGEYIDINRMRSFLTEKLVSAPVHIIVPNYADLRTLYRQVAALIRWGREARVLPVHIPK